MKYPIFMPCRLQLANAAMTPVLAAAAGPAAFALSCTLDTRDGGIRITAQPQPMQSSSSAASRAVQQAQQAAVPFLTASVARAGPLPLMPGVRAAGAAPSGAAARSGPAAARLSAAVLSAAAELLAGAGISQRLAAGAAAAMVDRSQQPHAQDAGVSPPLRSSGAVFCWVIGIAGFRTFPGRR